MIRQLFDRALLLKREGGRDLDILLNAERDRADQIIAWQRLIGTRLLEYRLYAPRILFNSDDRRGIVNLVGQPGRECFWEKVRPSSDFVVLDKLLVERPIAHHKQGRDLAASTSRVSLPLLRRDARVLFRCNEQLVQCDTIQISAVQHHSPDFLRVVDVFKGIGIEQH